MNSRFVDTALGQEIHIMLRSKIFKIQIPWPVTFDIQQDEIYLVMYRL